jgi:hypothetical protein
MFSQRYANSMQSSSDVSKHRQTHRLIARASNRAVVQKQQLWLATERLCNRHTLALTSADSTEQCISNNCVAYTAHACHDNIMNKSHAQQHAAGAYW